MMYHVGITLLIVTLHVRCSVLMTVTGIPFCVVSSKIDSDICYVEGVMLKRYRGHANQKGTEATATRWTNLPSACLLHALLYTADDWRSVIAALRTCTRWYVPSAQESCKSVAFGKFLTQLLHHLKPFYSSTMPLTEQLSGQSDLLRSLNLHFLAASASCQDPERKHHSVDNLPLMRCGVKLALWLLKLYERAHPVGRFSCTDANERKVHPEAHTFAHRRFMLLPMEQNNFEFIVLCSHANGRALRLCCTGDNLALHQLDCNAEHSDALLRCLESSDDIAVVVEYDAPRFFEHESCCITNIASIEQRDVPAYKAFVSDLVKSLHDANNNLCGQQLKDFFERHQLDTEERDFWLSDPDSRTGPRRHQYQVRVTPLILTELHTVASLLMRIAADPHVFKLLLSWSRR